MRRTLAFALLQATALLALYVPAARAVDDIAQVSVFEGNATLIRGAQRFGLARGVRIERFDRIETGASAFVRILFKDGSLLDLGPETRAQIEPPVSRRTGRAGPYLLAGVAKLTPRAPAADRVGINSVYVDTLSAAGVAVVRVGAGGAMVFVEDGELTANVRGGAQGATYALKRYHLLTLRRDLAPRLDPRPSSEFIAGLPRQFKDNIPAPSGPALAPRALGSITYAQAQPWLDAADPQIREQALVSWRGKADEAPFRDALLAGIDRHPEWIPVLFPPAADGKPGSGAALPAKEPKDGKQDGGSATAGAGARAPGN